jgi:hypothetical protein
MKYMILILFFGLANAQIDLYKQCGGMFLVLFLFFFEINSLIKIIQGDGYTGPTWFALISILIS